MMQCVYDKYENGLCLGKRVYDALSSGSCLLIGVICFRKRFDVVCPFMFLSVSSSICLSEGISMNKIYYCIKSCAKSH